MYSTDNHPAGRPDPATPGPLPLRVVLYTEAPAPGGVTKVVEWLACGMRSRAAFTVVHQPGSVMNAWADDTAHMSGAKTSATALKNSSGIGGWFDFPGLLKLRNTLKDAEIVHLHMHTPFSCLPVVWLSRFAGKKTIVATEHYIPQLRFLRRRPLPLPLRLVREIRNMFLLTAKRLTMGHISRIVTVSDANRTLLLENIGTHHAPRVVTIPNGVPVKHSPAAGAPQRIVDSEWHNRFPVLCTVAALNNQKGHRYLIESLPSVVHEFPNTLSLMVGSGPLLGELQDLVRMRGMDGHVLFLGERNDVEAILRKSHLFVLPSLFEGMPLSLLEAMEAGLPVVATGVDGTTEVVVAGETGLLVPPENSKALAEAIRRLAADRPLCSSMGETGRTRVRSLFSSDIMVDAYHRLYLQVLHREN